jgi:two-component system, OmpR family, sensor histidine kinase QseC
MKRQPRLQRRVLLTMLGVILMLFLAIFGLIMWGAFKRESGDLDSALLRSAQSLARTLDRMPDDASASAGITVFLHLMADSAANDPRGEPPPVLLVARRDGGLRVPPMQPGDADPLQLREGLSDTLHQGKTLYGYTAGSQRWTVTLLDDRERRTRWAARDVGLELLLYLAIALPVILLPVWLALRAALAPLQRLSDQVAARAPGDMSPLVLPKGYRELLPLQTALNRLFERVAGSFAREKAFVHDAAHELRTPLAVISTQAHVLQASEGPARHEAARRLQGAVARASHLTQQLLRLAQADATALAPRETVDVMNIVRDTLAGMAELASESGAELSLNGPDNALLATDARALRSMLSNLVDNALRYGGQGVAVDVAVEVETAAWRLRVCDNGPGIPAASREQVFERFWRGRAQDSLGAGLGLAIVREAARSLGGDVQLAAGPQGRGCCFTVNLPRT